MFLLVRPVLVSSTGHVCYIGECLLLLLHDFSPPVHVPERFISLGTLAGHKMHYQCSLSTESFPFHSPFSCAMERVRRRNSGTSFISPMIHSLQLRVWIRVSSNSGRSSSRRTRNLEQGLLSLSGMLSAYFTECPHINHGSLYFHPPRPR